jgi:hypothetical protein
MAKKTVWELVNPEGIVLTAREKVNAHPRDINRKTILLYWNGKPNGDIFLDRIAGLCREKAPHCKIIKAWETDPSTCHTESNYVASKAVAARLAEHKPDIVIGAPGDCSGSTTWLIVDQLNLERLGIPTVTVITSAFTELANSIPGTEGFQKPCLIEIPHPMGMLSRQEIEQKAQKAFNEIINGIISWQPPAESLKAGASYPAAVFELEGDINDVNRHFLEHKWSSGLPIIPPTLDSVNEMLSGTGRKASEILGQVPPRMGTLTVELAAVNAVMAGCLPQYMPALLAALEAFLDKRANWRMALTGTGTSQMVVIINGPIVKELGIACKQGAAGKGYHPNASLGYALNLIAYNVGGSRPPSMDRSTLASPSDYVCWVFGENEEALPPGWQPLHVEYGLNKSDSAVTVMCSYPPVENMDHWSSTAEEHMRWWGRTISPLHNMGGPCFPEALDFSPIIALGPEHASLITKSGWGKDKFRKALWKSTSIPLSTWPASCSPGKLVEKLGQIDTDAGIPIVSKPEQFVIVLAGGDGKQSHYFAPVPGAFPVCRPILK